MMFLFPVAVGAQKQKVEIDGFKYDIYHYGFYYYGSPNQAYPVYGPCAFVSGLLDEYQKDIVIPSEIVYNDTVYPVFGIDNWAFYRCQYLTSVSIPDDVVIIGAGAFQMCDSLCSIIIPDSTKYIGESAFKDCNNLSSIIIGKSVNGIGMKAFDGCSNISITFKCPSIPDYDWRSCPASLKEVIFEEGVTTIGVDAFWGCTSLASITIPDGVTTIGNGAFKNCASLKTISIPNSVTYIGVGAFASCTALTSINLSDNLIELKELLFDACTGLTSITIPSSVTSIGGSAFAGCTSLTSITIPSSVTSIGSYAFAGCSGIISIDIPDRVSTIMDYAFRDCVGLKSITIGNGVTDISGGAFWGCTGLEKVIIKDIAAWCNINFNDTESNPTCYSHKLFYCDEKTEIKDIVIPDGITRIRKWAFLNCSNLSSINIPDGVTSIGVGAFSGCSSLSSINIPDGVTRIEDATFHNCLELSSIRIPDNIVFVGDKAFFNTPWFDNLPDGLVLLGKLVYTYKGTMPENTSIIIPSGITNISNNAFKGCSGLGSLTIPSSVCVIDEKTFIDCNRVKTLSWNTNSVSPLCVVKYSNSSLKTLILGEDLTIINTDIFSNCVNLNSIIAYSRIPYQNTGNTTFDYLADKCVLYVPSGCKDIYRSTNLWSVFNDIRLLGVNVNNIYYGITSYEDKTVSVTHGRYTGSVNIPDNVEIDGIKYEVTEIEKEAFNNSFDLNTVTISKNVKNIGDRAFDKCTSLTKVVINGSPMIGISVFANCPSIKSVVSSSMIPSIITPFNPFVGGIFNRIEVEGGIKSTITDSILGRDITKFKNKKDNWKCTIMMDSIPAGMYNIKVGLLPGEGSFFHPIIYGVTDSSEIVLRDKKIEVERNGYYSVFDYVCQIPQSSYDSVLIADSLIVPQGCKSIKIALKGVDAFPVLILLDRVFFEPLFNIPEQAYIGPFDENVFNDATLFVPEGAEDAYRFAEGWKYFNNISVDTGVSSVQFDKDNAISVYDITGRKIEDSIENIKPGLYIINGKKYLKR